MPETLDDRHDKILEAYRQMNEIRRANPFADLCDIARRLHDEIGGFMNEQERIAQDLLMETNYLVLTHHRIGTEVFMYLAELRRTRARVASIWRIIKLIKEES